MTSVELYYDMLLLLNKNANQQKIDVSKENFVWLYNREGRKWYSSYLDRVSTNMDSVNINSLLIVDKQLALIDKKQEYVSYTMPEDFFDFVGSHSDAQKGKCNSRISNFLKKPKQIQSYIDDAFSSPSFEYEESICNMSEEKLIVYRTDYEINNTYLSYYKKLPQIDIEGYQKISGDWSSNVDDNLDPFLQNKIIDLVVLEVMRQFENGNGYKLSTERLRE